MQAAEGAPRAAEGGASRSPEVSCARIPMTTASIRPRNSVHLAVGIPGGHPPERGHPLNFSRLPPPIQPPPRSPLSCLSCLIHMLSFRAPLFPVVCGRYSHRRVNPPSSLMNHSFTGVPDHFKCCVCRDAPFGRIEQCAHGRDARRSSRNIDFTFNYLNMRVASRGGTAVELNGGARVRP